MNVWRISTDFTKIIVKHLHLYAQKMRPNCMPPNFFPVQTNGAFRGDFCYIYASCNYREIELRTLQCCLSLLIDSITKIRIDKWYILQITHYSPAATATATAAASYETVTRVHCRFHIVCCLCVCLCIRFVTLLPIKQIGTTVTVFYISRVTTDIT